MNTQLEIRHSITDKIVASLQKDSIPWRQPWGGINGGSPANVVSKKRYRGINTLLLACEGYQSRFWATYKQWSEIGGQVRKGQHGTRIVFWKPVKKAIINEVGETEDNSFLLMREYVVFNADQCDGVAIDKYRYQPNGKDKEFVDYTPAEEAIAATKADIRYGGTIAVYRPQDDCIHLPVKESFDSEVDFYSTAAHELVHWTGHKSRLNRLAKEARFGNAAYAFEELIAEIGGCFLTSALNIPQSDDLTNHNAYLANWLKVLQEDCGAILKASSQASKAADFILAFSQKEVSREEPAGVAG